MEIEQIKAFLTVTQTKNFTRSAELLHMAQSTITMRIKALEENIGKTLFERDTRKVELTAAGRAFFPYAQRILDLVQEGKMLTRMQGQFEESLVIGGSNSLWDYVLIDFICEFQTENPQASIRLVTGPSQSMIQKINDGIVDIGIMYDPPLHHDIEVIQLYSGSMLLVAAPDYPNKHEIILTKDLSSLKYIHLDWGMPFAEWFKEQFGKHYLHHFQVDHTSLLVKILTAGNGIGFLLDIIANGLINKKLLRELPFHTNVPIPERSFYLVYSRKRVSSIAQSCIDRLKNVNFK